MFEARPVHMEAEEEPEASPLSVGPNRPEPGALDLQPEGGLPCSTISAISPT